MHNIGKNLKTLRLKNELSYRQLSAIANVSHTVIMNIESGKIKNPTIGIVLKLCHALNIEINEILK